MEKIYCSIVLLLLLVSGKSQAQVDSFRVEFRLAGESLTPGKAIFFPSQGDSIRVKTLRFYLSDVELFEDEELIGNASREHILVDLAHPNSWNVVWIRLKPANVNRIRFSIGIDSLTNVSGARGGDLDPTRGMYWAWQSGFINFKLEGTSPSCPGRKNAFMFHLGGYQHPFKSIQTVELKGKANGQATLELELSSFLERVDLKEHYRIMSPNAQAVHLSAWLPKMFTWKP